MPGEPSISEYERNFPAFYIQSHTTVAPLHQFQRDRPSLTISQRTIDEGVAKHSTTESSPSSKARNSFEELLHLPSRKRHKGIPSILSVKNLVARLQSSSVNPIDLTETSTVAPISPLDLLKSVSVKYLRYAEDVRPPYVGTYSKCPLGHSVRKLCRQPFTRALPATNYDYDSEAEWEEPEEGEDLESEGEEEIGDDDEGDDMGEFLDDEETDGNGPNGSKRRHIMGDVQPICTGLHWEGSERLRGPNMVAYGQASLDMKIYKMQMIHGLQPWVLTVVNITDCLSRFYVAHRSVHNILLAFHPQLAGG